MKAWLGLGCAVLLAAGCGDDVAPSAADSGTSTGGDIDTESDSDDPPAQPIDPAAVPTPKAGRLTDVQYRHTVLDVLGVALTDEDLEALPADIPTGRDYSTTLEPQFFNSNYVLAYAELARIASAQLDPDALVSQYGGCAQLDPSCREDLVSGLGQRLFRRPLTDQESTRYLDLAVAIAQADQTDETHVVRGIVQAMMQAPQFLYRIERETDGTAGELRTIDGYELATRLSYFLWQSAPDAALLEFAAGPAGDGVFDEDAVAPQIERMIADGKFVRARTLFWGDYTMAVRSTFGTSDTALSDALRSSLLATLDRISGSQGQPQPLSELFDARQLVMTPAVAELAGATPIGDGLQVYDVADTVERLGVVTHPAFLASIGTTSFVGRGLFLSERLLCQHVAEPPPEVEDEIESTAQATSDMTPREASEFRFGLEAVCRGCHTQFEPVAYAFERYDMLGRHSATDDQGRPLYSDGLLPAFGDRPEISFHDARQLLASLAGVDAVYGCLVENMTQFGTGLPVNLRGDFHDLATSTFIDEGRTFDALARAIANSEQRTLLRVVEP
ncbi:MAG: DUF1588 domain-containing protein [Deltaproteobacteria bacterium]|nr:DUF1588 domain-containing protein [Deltaproteobacteria bacterium]